MGSYTVTALTRSKDIAEVEAVMAIFDRDRDDPIDSNVDYIEMYDYYHIGVPKLDSDGFVPVFLTRSEAILNDDVLSRYHRRYDNIVKPSYWVHEFASSYYQQRVTPSRYAWTNVARVRDIEFEVMRSISLLASRDELIDHDIACRDSGAHRFIERDDNGILTYAGSHLHWSSEDELHRYRSLFHTHAVITPDSKYLEPDTLTQEECDAFHNGEVDAIVAIKKKNYEEYVKFLQEFPDCYAWFIGCGSESI